MAEAPASPGHCASPDTAGAATGGNGFAHEALFYGDDGDFLAGTLPFIAEGLAADGLVLVAVEPRHISLLCGALGPDTARIEVLDMTAVGGNPARIIPVWREALARAEREGRGLWGIGEPAWPGRSAAALTECAQHEALLNRAFAAATGFRLRCPYNLTGLEAGTLEIARTTHPLVVTGGDGPRPSPTYAGEQATRLAEPLDEAPDHAAERRFGPGELRDLRGFVAAQAAAAGLGEDRVDDLVVAVHEVAANSLEHGGGGGILRLWREGSAVISEIADAGKIGEPLAGRWQPATESRRGRGLWLANHLCDLVRLRSGEPGTVVRLHVEGTRPSPRL